MTLELTHEFLVVQVPHGDVAVRTTTEADLRIGTDGQSVAGWRRRLQLGLNARIRL